MKIEKAMVDDAEEILSLQKLAYQGERNLCLYEKLGYKRFKTVRADEKLSIVYLEKYHR